ncbi:hypothetical protein P691DRAFT_286757 [Macrolepiota fuliginosa MF-IS2]|uniref:Uncharacterized protein n=1 Tax=Macrolepiota fuliginosa MF-IS2 TaxID=1400762 RepID=A0A9P5XMQ7_9AGAR|nr:hypothetical protein P691DRAFT_286757 [Macrolepiota fuliginosa MF-IS2]
MRRPPCCLAFSHPLVPFRLPCFSAHLKPSRAMPLVKPKATYPPRSPRMSVVARCMSGSQTCQFPRLYTRSLETLIIAGIVLSIHVVHYYFLSHEF